MKEKKYKVCYCCKTEVNAKGGKVYDGYDNFGKKIKKWICKHCLESGIAKEEEFEL